MYLISERTKQSSLLKETVTEAGYRSVDSFMRAFNKSQMLVEEYLKTQGGIENGNKSPQQTQQKKQSVLDKLHQYNEEANAIRLLRSCVPPSLKGSLW